MNKVIFSSKSDEWETPKEFYDELNSRFEFDADMAASDLNFKHENYFTKKINSLSIDWSKSAFNGKSLKTVFINPPYSQVNHWVSKAASEAKKGVKSVLLIPSRTDTKWFHDFIYRKKNVSVEFLRGRLKFVGAKHNAPFPSMVVVFEEI